MTFVFRDTETTVAYYYEQDGVYEFPTRQPLYLYSSTDEESESTDDEESESENNNTGDTADFPISETTSDIADPAIANRRSDRLNKKD